MLFEQQDRKSARGRIDRAADTGGTAADNDNVPRAGIFADGSCDLFSFHLAGTNR